MINFGICFSKDFVGENPLSHVGTKFPVYLEFLKMCQKEGWEVYVLTRKTYSGNGIFKGVWFLDEKGTFQRILDPIHIDLVYDRAGGIAFPPEDDENTICVNRRDFKLLCWNKWQAYLEVGEYMPRTFWVGSGEALKRVLPEIATKWVVLKPINGLKGKGIFIGSKKDALDFKFPGKKPRYIAQEFIDTAGGVSGVAGGLHDIRLAMMNNKIVWSHVRTPAPGRYKSNVAAGGTLKEIPIDIIPEHIKRMALDISEKFYKKYDNPVYSLDFGMMASKAYLFEINDQIGFPTLDMRNKDNFLAEMIKNFKKKLT